MSTSTLLQAAAVAAGSAVGAMARWQVGLAFNPVFQGFPLGTWLVNVVGGLLIGMAMVVLQRWPDPLLRLLLVTGCLGGFTTFSSFSSESLALLQAGRYGWALAHTLAHVVASLAAAAGGFALARAIWPAA